MIASAPAEASLERQLCVSCLEELTTSTRVCEHLPICRGCHGRSLGGDP